MGQALEKYLKAQVTSFRNNQGKTEATIHPVLQMRKLRPRKAKNGWIPRSPSWEMAEQRFEPRQSCSGIRTILFL